MELDLRGEKTTCLSADGNGTYMKTTFCIVKRHPLPPILCSVSFLLQATHDFIEDLAFSFFHLSCDHVSTVFLSFRGTFERLNLSTASEYSWHIQSADDILSLVS